MKNKKWLWISLITLDVAVTVFLFVIHIIMLANISGKTPEELNLIKQQQDLVGALMRNTTLYLVLFVIPLFLILAANIIGLVLYVRKQTKKEPVKLENLSEDEMRELQKRLDDKLKNSSKE